MKPKRAVAVKPMMAWALAGSTGDREIITQFGVPFLLSEDKKTIERWLPLGTFRIARVQITELRRK